MAFILFVAYILHFNQEVFYTAYDRSEFLYGSSFFHILFSRPFSLIEYIGSWLTQLFYYPALGSVVLLVIWTFIFFAGINAFKLHGTAKALMMLPVSCLLSSVVDLGYWIYISPVRGYWFSQSIAYLIIMLLLWIARNTPRKCHLLWYVFAFCSYPILGWFAILFVLCLIFIGKPSWREIFGVVLILFAARIWHILLYSNLKFVDVSLGGFPCFETSLDSSTRLTIPFVILGVVTVVLAFCGRYLTKIIVPLACSVACILFTWLFMFNDKTYIDEMRMVRYAEQDNWKAVVEVASKNKRLTASMIMLKNIALMNEGGLLERSFSMGSVAYPIYNPDSVHVDFLEIASPIVCYNYGMFNESIRLNFENAMQSGFSPFHLKSLARCSYACGEDNLLNRYVSHIRHLLFHEDWQPYPISDNLKELVQCYPEELIGVENSDKYIVNNVSMWYESDSKLASEQALYYSMIRCDSGRFWASLRKYVKLHQDASFPKHAQEAYILYMDKSPEEKRMMLPVEESVYVRYQQFWKVLEKRVKSGVKLGDVKEQMHEEWGDTYWYYIIFGTMKY